MIQTTTIRAELSQPNTPAVVYAKQHDADTRVIEVSLYSNGVAYNPPYESSGIVNIAKPDGTGCYYDVDSISENVVTFTLIEQALTTAGTAHTEISLVTANEERLTSFMFDIIIEARALEDSVIVSSDYYNALLDASSAYIKHATLLKVKGYYPTLAALEAAISNPIGGDMYAVGTQAPYNIYVYDPVSETWIDNGAFGQSGTIYLGETAGTADALTIADYTGTIPHGYTFTIMPHVNVNTGATLKIGNNAALPLLSHEGTPIANYTLFQNVPITLIYRQLPTPAYITIFDTETIMLATGEPTVEGHTLKWENGIEDVRGYYVDDVSLKSGSTAPGQTATYSMKLNDPNETEIGTFDVYNGVDGTITGLTAERATVTDSNGEVTTSDTTATELGYVHGVTSDIQTQLNGKQASLSVTGGRALYSNSAGTGFSTSATTSTELGYLSGVTSAIQTQLNNKEAAISIPSSYTSYSGSYTLSNNTYYKISQNGSLTLTAPSGGWAHGMIYTGSYSYITFSPYTFLIAPPTLQSGKYYEFDVLDGVWVISERT